MAGILSALKIVTVEDSSIIVTRIQNMLCDLQDVEFVGNASTIPLAMELIRTTLPHVAILDINLRSPDGKTGINLLNIVRKLYPEMKIIMLTNLTDDHYRIMCQEYGADYFFDKSNDFDMIPETLNEIRELSRASG